MLFKRDLAKTLLKFTKFPVISVIGPRQSGKTTLVKNVFKQHKFISLEEPELREFAMSDPKRFLREYDNKHGIIIDEFQYVPQILSYIQLAVDSEKDHGYFILTGSQNFLINHTITQSLAGRIGLLTLLPLSHRELSANKLITNKPIATIDTIILQGGYPRFHKEQFLPQEFYPSYTHTYVERDVRQITRVESLHTFQKFMQLCASRIGQILNVNDLAMHCEINRQTAVQWLTILEASYILFLLKPYFNNFNKRVTKSPKLYFYDTGLACSLLKIRTSEHLALSPFRGHLFENLVIADLYKQYFNLGLEPTLYFWRDQNGRVEIDCILDLGDKLIPIEIKSGETINTEFFYNLKQWNKLTTTDAADNYIIYGGLGTQHRSQSNVINLTIANNLITKLNFL